MTDHDPVKVHVVQDDTTPKPVPPNVVGRPRSINIRTTAFGDGPQLILPHTPKRVRGWVSPLYGAALGLVWVCESESNAQAVPPIGIPLVSGTPGNAGTAVVDFLEVFSTTELWAVADPSNTNLIIMRIWSEEIH